MYDMGMFLGALMAMFALGSLFAWVLRLIGVKTLYSVRMYTGLAIATVFGAILYSFGQGAPEAIVPAFLLYGGASSAIAAIMFLTKK